jgi:tRNA dimethylallyltransferase
VDLPPFAIAGPTASGKSALAAAVAERIGGEIVGADAFQVYRGLDILTAKPGPEILAAAPHHLVGEIDPATPFNVALYREMALRAVGEIRFRGKVPIAVGGSGLYLRSLAEPLAELPPADPGLRSLLEAEPTESLLRRLAALDPGALGWIDRRNRRRLVRAIEVCVATGKPFSLARSSAGGGVLRGVLLDWDREDLRERIRLRAEAMFDAGVADEVRSAGTIGPTASQVLGLAEIRAHLRGEISAAGASEAIISATRRYAKRQMTWFRRESGLTPVPLSAEADFGAVAERVAAAALRHEKGRNL